MFFEEKKINSVLNCSKCQERLDDPKNLPCGDNICSSCVASIHVNNSKFECIVCNKTHTMPEEGLPTNKKLLTLISMHPDEVYRGKTAEKLKQSLKEMKKRTKSLLFAAENGIDFIKEYCLNLRNEVQLATEKFIQQINEYSDEFIKEINEYEIGCIKSYTETKQETKDELINITKELEHFESKWNEYLKQIKLDDEIVLNAFDEASKLNISAQLEQFSLENHLLKGKVLKYDISLNKPNKSILGSLVEFNAMKSEILSNRQYFDLMNLCSQSKNWELVYRASRDGFGSNDFHSKCDKKQNTLAIIKTTNGNIFGGYTEQDWTHTNGFKNDVNSFIFSLVNKENKPLVMKPQNQTLIYCNSRFGPTFGNGHDIHISSNSNGNTLSYSNLGISYKHPNYENGSNEAESFLAGSFYFQTVEIEVYTKK